MAEGFEKIVRNKSEMIYITCHESKGKQKDWVKLSVREAFGIE
jgi:hypothetical protein